jgi:hypothetical protein
MIINEPFEMPINVPVKGSSSGDFFNATTFVFYPPKPRMAQDLFLMRKYFNQMTRDLTKLVMQEHKDSIQTLQAGVEVKSLHEEFSEPDNSDDAKKAAKLAEIEDRYNNFCQAIPMVETVDFFQFTKDFGRMISTNSLCSIKGLDSLGVEKKAKMIESLWLNDVDIDDRIRATIRYCCFFVLTSTSSL